jgi:hypothetical protein
MELPALRRPFTVMLAYGAFQLGCAGTRPVEPSAWPSAAAMPPPVTPAGLSVTTSERVCSAELVRGESGCEYAFGVDILAPQPDGSYLHCDGKTRVACGTVGNVCGMRVFCSCPKEAAPR